MQAYGKRALDVIDWVAATARAESRRMTVRLVKGAYWDSEIKRGQERGLADYPVYTRKLTTDVSYLACAGCLFGHADVIRAQFATHNAHSIAAILELAPPGVDYEFQRLHGMGRLLYAEAARQIAVFRGCGCTLRWANIRIYWPIWCGACSKTAPIPPSSIASWTSRCRWPRSCAIRSPTWSG